tara:strand:+ start:29 stop:328 length:300 start_codon:yes stop_codon:yes gene_type:complete
MIPGMKDDDLWMKPPVNYTPWFKWLLNRRQESFDRRLRIMKKRLKVHEKRSRDFNRCMDLYLVEYNKEDGEIKSNFQREIEGKPNRYFLTFEEFLKLLG